MILVTGDRGFIGSELKQYLTAQGHDVHGLDWDTRGNTYTARTPIEWIFHMGAISETNADNWEDIVRKNIQDTQDWITTAEVVSGIREDQFDNRNQMERTAWCATVRSN